MAEPTPQLDEFPNLKGCAKLVASFLLTYGVLAAIFMAAGYPAACWFGLGALLTSVLAFWEAGKNSRSATPPEPKDQDHG